MRRYGYIYYRLFVTQLQQLFAFRANTFVHFLYGPAYFAVLYMIQQTAYRQAPTLGGWSRDEATLLMSVCFLFYNITFILYIVALRSFLWDGVRHGILDQYLTKPASPLFFIAWTRPDVAQIPLLVLSMLLVIKQVWVAQAYISIIGISLALLAALLGLLLHYLAVTTYASLGIIMTRAEQVLELFDKISDSGIYPANIFPSSVQFILVAVVPVAFFGYIPTLFLLGYFRWQWIALECVLIGCFIVLHRLAWKYAFKQYTSASS